MAGGLEIPVSAPGLGQTAEGFAQLGTKAEHAAGSMGHTSNAVQKLEHHLRRGAFVKEV